MIEGVIFDLDGVLLDSEHVWDEVREQLARERGGRWHERAQREMMGMSSLEWSRYMHDEIGVPEPPEEISAEVVRRLEAVYRDTSPPCPVPEKPSSAWPSAGRSPSPPRRTAS